MKCHICVYDYETDGKYPDVCEPIQLAACMLHPVTLEVVPDSEFTSFMRPTMSKVFDVDMETERDETWDEYYERVEDTITWHAKNQAEDYYSLTKAEQENLNREILQTWIDAPAQSHVWSRFTDYLLKYNANQSSRTKFNAPIRAGANIRKFDNIITDRMCKRFKTTTKGGEQKIFHPRDVVDLLDICFYWFESLGDDGPKSYSMDNLRPFFGISDENAHDALKDIRDEAWIIQKFMRLHRKFASKVKFRGAFLQQKV